MPHQRFQRFDCRCVDAFNALFTESYNWKHTCSILVCIGVCDGQSLSDRSVAIVLSQDRAQSLETIVTSSYHCIQEFFSYKICMYKEEIITMLMKGKSYLCWCVTVYDYIEIH